MGFHIGHIPWNRGTATSLGGIDDVYASWILLWMSQPPTHEGKSRIHDNYRCRLYKRKRRGYHPSPSYIKSATHAAPSFNILFSCVNESQ